MKGGSYYYRASPYRNSERTSHKTEAGESSGPRSEPGSLPPRRRLTFGYSHSSARQVAPLLAATARPPSVRQGR
eukprot:4357080-Pyramimonas_sp.AAC.1